MTAELPTLVDLNGLRDRADAERKRLLVRAISYTPVSLLL